MFLFAFIHSFAAIKFVCSFVCLFIYFMHFLFLLFLLSYGKLNKLHDIKRKKSFIHFELDNDK